MKIGTKFVGKINNHPFQLVSIKIDILTDNKYAIIKDLKSGKIFNYSLQALEHCEIEVIS